jgi:cell division septation protein DedD
VSSSRCERCGAAARAGQEYCLQCGNRLGPTGGSVVRTLREHPWVGGWLAPALLGLAIAVIGTAAAIAISDGGEEAAEPITLTGGSLTVTGDGSTLTAPEPTAPATTEPAATTGPPTTTAPPPRPANPATVTWPRDQRGWTIVLLSLPQANGRAAAAAKAAEARRGGLRRVGILDSSRYASLHPDYYVVFTGVFDSEVEAASALQRARAVFPGAYQREIVP